MYLRHAVRRKGGKAHTYWRLVRSVRRGDRVVQETVAHLGELDAQGRAKARALAQQITGRGAQRELCEAEVAPGAAIAVRLNEIRLERPRAFGAVWLGWTLWRALGLDTLCAEGCPRGARQCPGPRWPRSWSSPACVSRRASCISPRTGIVAPRWRTCSRSRARRSTTLYRALDRLLPHKPAIETHLKERLGEALGL